MKRLTALALVFAIGGVSHAMANDQTAQPMANAAGIFQRLNAADEVERVLNRRYPRFSWVANCRHTSRTRFTCSLAGFRGRTFADGRARVRKSSRYSYRAKITSLRFN